MREVISEHGGDGRTGPAVLEDLVRRVRDRDRRAFDELFCHAYPSVVAYANQLMLRQRSDHTLDPAALANEAFLRLSASSRWAWTTYTHFVAAAFQAMRHQLVDHANGKRTLKRGGGRRRERLSGIIIAIEDRFADLVDVNDALDRIRVEWPDVALVIDLKFNAGFGMREIAQFTGRSLRSVEEDWTAGRKRLRSELDV